MGRNGLIQAVAMAGSIAFWAGLAHADEYQARLSGFNEVGGLGAGETGAILSNGAGTLRLGFDKAGAIDYTLTYSGLSNVLQAHIHFGKVHVAGGIIAFLCTNLANGPAGTPSCPTSGGSVNGTITAASIVGPSPQGVSVGDFDALTDALASNTAYANVHTKAFPSGEIRGQVRRSEKNDK